jgi:hypothetical protein
MGGPLNKIPRILNTVTHGCIPKISLAYSVGLAYAEFGNRIRIHRVMTVEVRYAKFGYSEAILKSNADRATPRSS